MALKAKQKEERLEELREKNKNNPNYPKLEKQKDKIKITINNQTYIGTYKEIKEKYKNIPYLEEELENLYQNDFITHNMKIIEEQLKSKF